MVARPLPWLVGFAIAFVWIGGAWVVTHWKVLLPTPAGLIRYVCPGGDTTVYYRLGADTVRITSAAGSIQGTVHAGKIDWGNYATANDRLGFPPPVEIRYSSATSVQVNGGRFGNVDCIAR